MSDSSFQSWEKLRKLGQGGFGKVWLVRTDKGHQLAAKYVEIAQFDDKALAAVKRETEILKKLSHPNVVRFVTERRQGDCLILFTEFIDGGDLASKGRLSESVAKGYLRQICSGLNYLHSQKVVHRDIKGENVMVAKDGVVKLIDFGISINLYVTYYGTGVTNAVMSTDKPMGTLPFMAPEVLKDGQFSVKSDVWALGITVYQMMAGEPPFQDLWGNSGALIDRITRFGAPTLPEGRCSANLQDFYATCTAKNPGSRPPVRDLLQHQLFAQ